MNRFFFGLIVGSICIFQVVIAWECAIVNVNIKGLEFSPSPYDYNEKVHYCSSTCQVDSATGVFQTSVQAQTHKQPVSSVVLQVNGASVDGFKADNSASSTVDFNAGMNVIRISTKDAAANCSDQYDFVCYCSVSSCDPEPVQAAKNDLLVLNYALSLEHLEAYFYTTYQIQFTATDFKNAGFNQQVYDYFNIIEQHEQAHVKILTSTVNGLGGVPVQECKYTFPVTDVKSYVATAQILENTGVSAYDGGINSLSDASLQEVAATIDTVEARHASYLNDLIGTTPFPDATDTPKTPAEIVQAISAFIVSCPASLTLPTIRPGAVSFNSSYSSQSANSFKDMNKIPGEYTSYEMQNDIKTLNFALTLEHLESNFYKTFQQKYNAGDFSNAGFNQSHVYDYFNLIDQHEQAHVNIITKIISDRGAKAVPECTYNFSVVQSVQDYVKIAKLLENTGVSAYDGAVNAFTDTGLQEAAATIATVEARHASYLNRLSGVLPFPDDTDKPLSPADIIKAASGFIQSCPYSFDLPSVAPNGNNEYIQPPTYANKPSASDMASIQSINQIKGNGASFVNPHFSILGILIVTTLVFAFKLN